MKDKTIHRIVRRVVNEALGVNSYVEKAVDDIIDEIYKYESWGVLPEKTVTVEFPVLIKKGSVDYYIKDKRILIIFRIYDFQNNEDLEYFKENYSEIFNKKMYHGSTYQSSTDDDIVIRFSLIRAGGKITNYSYNVLQHELDHAIKRVLSGKNYIKPYTNQYRNAQSVISNKEDVNNKYVRYSAWIVYWNLPHEQDAFANGLYSVLAHSKPTKENLDKLIYSSDYYTVIVRLREYLQEFNELQGEERERIDHLLQNKIGYGVSKLIKIGENTLSKFIHNLGRIKTLILQRLQQNNN
jgi:hypothetical protein